MARRDAGWVLGIDVGTSSTKVLAVDPGGRVRATAEKSYPLHSPQPGWNEQHPQVWWKATQAAIQALGRSFPLNRIGAIGVTGQMHGSVFLDRHHQPLRPALLWNDQRTTAECEEARKLAGGEASLFRLTNNAALTGYTLPKILWLRNHEPKHFAKVDKVCLPKDWIVYSLSGELVSDVSDASGTLLLDIQRRDWSRRWLDRLGLDPGLLPPVVESAQPIGRLRPEVARRLGLLPATVVVAGAGDQPAAAVGMGIVREGLASATVGTSGVVFAALDRFVSNRFAPLQNFCAAVEDGWCAFGCMLTAGGALDWYRRLRPGRESFQTLLSQARRAPAGSRGLVFLPYLDGERCPHPDPQARAGWLGLRREHTDREMTRSLIEGITYGLRDQIDLLAQAGIEVKEIRSAGGGAKSAFWLQLQADIFGRPVAALSTPHASALGAAILALVGKGQFASVPEAADALVKVSDRYLPAKKTREVYREGYERYRSLYPKVKPWFAQAGYTSGAGA